MSLSFSQQIFLKRYSRVILITVLFLSIGQATALDAIISTVSKIFGLKTKENEDPFTFYQQVNLPEIDYNACLTIDFPEDTQDEDSQEYLYCIPKIIQMDNEAPISSNILRYRLKSDISLLKKGLENRGYFDGNVTSTWNKSKEDEKKSYHIDIHIQTGQRYWFTDPIIQIDGENYPEVFYQKVEKHSQITVGDPVNLDTIVDSVARIKKYFQNNGYPLVEVDPPYGKINEQDKTLTITYKISPHGKKDFGEATVIGNKSTQSSYILNRVKFMQGDVFDQRKIEKTQKSLISSEIFSSVILTPHLSHDEKSAPITIQVQEAPPRSVGTGIRYATQEGIGGKLFWIHRNLWGGGEKFTAKFEGSQEQLDAVLSLEQPDIIWQDFTLVTKLEATKANTKAYIGQIYTAYAGFKYPISEEVITDFGVSYEYSHLRQQFYETHSFTTIPLDILYDTTNDPINPFRGWKMKFHIAPFFGDVGDKNHMLKTSIFGSYYLRLIKKDLLVLAFWSRIGKINQSPLERVPLDKRFYSGGINSVRGYAYQRLGPINIYGRPSGGTSLIEGGIEPRFRLGENLGGCIFLEAGKVSPQGMPNFLYDPKYGKQKKFLYGYGIGARYYTDIGPIRLDLAFPSKRRSRHYDAPFQVYVSIGQSF